LKAEIFELRGKGKDYANLREKIVETEMAYRRTLEEKVTYEDNLRNKIDHSYVDS
jgi:hypothetical protein